MNTTNANSEIKPLVRKLLSWDPVQFNAAVNAHFAADCTYQGRGLKVAGASQLKHAAYLLNTIDLGSAANVADEDIRWDAAGSTAIVKATRNVRPLAFPLFSFAVPTKSTLTFHAEEDAKDALYCTQWRDEWPLETILTKLPLISLAYSSLFVPLLTVVFLWTSNLVFWIHSKREIVEHRYVRNASQAYHKKVQPRLSRSLVQGFDAGVNATEQVGQHGVHIVSRIAYVPLKITEELARTATVLANLALPDQLQLPYPSVFAERAPLVTSALIKAEKQSTPSEKSVEKPEAEKAPKETPNSPRSKVSGDISQDSAAAGSDEGDKKRKAEAEAHAESRHAKVVVGPAEDGAQPQGKEIDLVTHTVTEHAQPAESAQQSLYDVLKKDDQLPHPGSGKGANGGGKKSGGKKKKNGGRK